MSFASIPACFEFQVQRYPQHVALKTSQGTLTYTGLNTLANRVSWALLNQYGAAPEPVALLLEQVPLFIAAMLGVLKAGKFYLPLEPAHPLARTRYVLEDAQARLIITDTAHLALASTLSQDRCRVLNLDLLDAQVPVTNPGVSLTADALATLLYTSGSTGAPKGVFRDHCHELHEVQGWTA
jgi:non-ribosomal peptide synthetase component F